MNKLLGRAAELLQRRKETKYKQVILVRDDLKLPKGKLAAQVAHASVETVMKADQGVVQKWRAEGMMKIVLKVKDEKELLNLHHQADYHGLTSALITDAGHTVVEPGTITVCGIGPALVSRIDEVTGHLQLL
ncbi:peptidyl-tRNA hydrolase [Candidatus Woesearchaeota archaeon]|nr:peptidyl-tRNA hydrolase [Candidatus Woesearchaeota archaeon]